jgi:uncharacterized membrane protein
MRNYRGACNIAMVLSGIVLIVFGLGVVGVIVLAAQRGLDVMMIIGGIAGLVVMCILFLALAELLAALANIGEANEERIEIERETLEATKHANELLTALGRELRSVRAPERRP